MVCTFSARRLSQRGASLVEYSLLVVLITLVSVSSVTRVGSRVRCMYINAADALDNHGPSCFVQEEAFVDEIGDVQEAGPGIPEYLPG